MLMKKICKFDFKRFSILVGIILLFFYIIPLFFGNFYNKNGDDLIQYRVFMRNVFENIKEGDFSFLNISDDYGNSVISFLYYVPLDIFTILTFLLSYLIPFDYAYSFITLFKIFSGTLLFYQVSKKLFKFNDKTIFYISLLYLGCGSLVAYTVFDTYVSLYFYVPLTLFVFYRFKNKNKFAISIYTTLLLLYNVNLAYMLILGISVSYFLLEIYKSENLKETTKDALKTLLSFVPYVLIGVLISMFVIFPYLLYIAEYAMLNRGFSVSYWFKKLLYLIGLPIFNNSLNYYNVNDGVLKIDYIVFQMNLFIGIIAFLFLLQQFKDKKNVKIIMLIEAILLVVPIFDFIFNLSIQVYSRWYISLSLVNLIIVGHGIEEYGFNPPILKNKIVIGLLMLYSLLYSILFAYLVTGFSVFNWLSLTPILLGTIFLIGSIKNGNKKKMFMNLIVVLDIGALIFTGLNYNLFGISLDYKKNVELKNEFVDAYNRKDNLERILIDRNVTPINSGYFSDEVLLSQTTFNSLYNQNFNEYKDNFMLNDTKSVTWTYTNFSQDPFAVNNLAYKYIAVWRENTDFTYYDTFYKRIGEIEDYYIYETNTTEAYLYDKSFNELSSDIFLNDLLIQEAVYTDSNFLPSFDTKEVKSNHIIEKVVVDKTKVEEEKIDYYNYFYGIDYKDETLINTYNFSLKNKNVKDKIITFDNGISKEIIYLDVSYKNGTSERYFTSTFIAKDEIKNIKIYFTDIVKDKLTFYFYDKDVIKTRDKNVDVTIKGDNINIKLEKQDKNNILVLPLTYMKEYECQEGFNVIKANGGLIGIEVPEGVEEVNLVFKIRGLKEGSITSLVGVSLLIGVIFIPKVVARKKNSDISKK